MTCDVCEGGVPEWYACMRLDCPDRVAPQHRVGVYYNRRQEKAMIIDTQEKITLIGALCDRLKWTYTGTRADRVQIAFRIVELCKSLPDDGDGA